MMHIQILWVFPSDEDQFGYCCKIGAGPLLIGRFVAHWENMVIGFYLRSSWGESNPLLLAPILSTPRRAEGEWGGIAHILSIFEERDKSLRAEHVTTENKQEAFLGAACIAFFDSHRETELQR